VASASPSSAPLPFGAVFSFASGSATGAGSASYCGGMVA